MSPKLKAALVGAVIAVVVGFAASQGLISQQTAEDIKPRQMRSLQKNPHQYLNSLLPRLPKLLSRKKTIRRHNKAQGDFNPLLPSASKPGSTRTKRPKKRPVRTVGTKIGSAG